MKYFLSLVLLFATHALRAQVQNPAVISIEGFGGERDEGIYVQPKPTPDGGFILTYGSQSIHGDLHTSCAPNSDGIMIFKKYNSAGTNIEWEKCYPASLDSSFRFMFEVPNRGVILGGERVVPGKRSFRMRKEDDKGNILWSKEYGGSKDEKLKDMIATSDHGYIMIGQSGSDDGDVNKHYGSLFTEDIWVVKIDSNGSIVWSNVFGGTDDEIAYAIVESGSAYYIVGATGSTDQDAIGNHGSLDAFVVKIDTAGNKIWSRCLGGTDLDGYYVAACSDGNSGVIVANGSSSTDGDAKTNRGVRDVWVINMSSDNQIIWSNSYGAINSGESPYAACLSVDGSIWIGGISGGHGEYIDTSFGNGDAWVFNIDNKGKILKGKVLGSSERDQANIVFPLSSGGVLVGGYYTLPGPIGGEFPSQGYGGLDIFLSILAPWTTSLSDPNYKAISIKLHPNPATDELTVVTRADDTVTIIDAFGRLIYSNFTKSGVLKICTSDWDRGIYYVRTTGVTTSATERLLLQ